MSSKTKIVVLHMKEIIYTAIFAALGLILLCLVFFMFSSDKQKEKDVYSTGIYSSSLSLNDTLLEVEVAVGESSRIESIRLVNADETVSAMYPLLQPAIEDLAEQICRTQSLEHISLSEDSPYTSQLLLNAIEDALTKAAAK